VETLVDGQFSLPHLIGLAACGGPPGPGWHTPEALRNESVRRFARRVRVREYPDAAPILEKLLREQGHAELIPTAASLTARGTTYTAVTDHAIGDPWDENGALDDTAIESKFRAFCRPSLGDSSIDSAVRAIADLPDAPSIEGVVAALVSG